MVSVPKSDATSGAAYLAHLMRQPYEFASRQVEVIQQGRLKATNVILRVAELALRAIASSLAFLVGLPMILMVGKAKVLPPQPEPAPEKPTPIPPLKPKPSSARVRVFSDNDWIARARRWSGLPLQDADTPSVSSETLPSVDDSPSSSSDPQVRPEVPPAEVGDDVIPSGGAALPSDVTPRGGDIEERSYKDENEAYEAMQRALKNARANENMGNSRKTPSLADRLKEKHRNGVHITEELSVDGHEVGLVALQGKREDMEDHHFAGVISVKVDGNATPVEVPVFGVFDGHGGAGCSEFVSNRIAKVLAEKLEEHGGEDIDSMTVLNATKLAMVELQKQFFQERPNDTSGTTAAVAFILDDMLYVASVGDSRVVLQNGDHFMQLTMDASIENLKFRRGVEKRGGEVYTLEVVEEGEVVRTRDCVLADECYRYTEEPHKPNLNLVRTIGDREFSALSPRPKVVGIPVDNLRGGDARLVLACDGLYEGDQLTTSEVCRAAKKYADRGWSAKKLATGLARKAIDRGSGDNVSVMVVRL